MDNLEKMTVPSYYTKTTLVGVMTFAGEPPDGATAEVRVSDEGHVIVRFPVIDTYADLVRTRIEQGQHMDKTTPEGIMLTSYLEHPAVSGKLSVLTNYLAECDVAAPFDNAHANYGYGVVTQEDGSVTIYREYLLGVDDGGDTFPEAAAYLLDTAEESGLMVIEAVKE